MAIWVLHFLWARCGPGFLYMKDLTHFTFSVTRRGRSDCCSDFRGEGTTVTQLAKVPVRTGTQVCWLHSLCSWRLRRRQGQQWRTSDWGCTCVRLLFCSSRVGSRRRQVDGAFDEKFKGILACLVPCCPPPCRICLKSWGLLQIYCPCEKNPAH